MEGAVFNAAWALCLGCEGPALFVPQRDERIDFRSAPCRQIAGKNPGAGKDDAGEREDRRVVGLGFK